MNQLHVNNLYQIYNDTAHITILNHRIHPDEGNRCPEEHPFAFYGHNRCCATNKEKLSDSKMSKYGLQDQCKGKILEEYSLCCADDQYIKCPDKPCVEYDWPGNMVTPVMLSHHVI